MLYKIIKRHAKKKHSGMSMIETMLVFSIVAVAIVAMIQVYRQIRERSDVSKTRTIGYAIQSGIQNFRVDLSRYPNALAELATPPSDNNEKKRWQGPYVPKEYIVNNTIVDAWGNEFDYKLSSNKNSFELESFGKDGVNSETGHVVID